MSTRTKQTATPTPLTDNGQRPGADLDLAVAEAEKMVQAAEAARDGHVAEIDTLTREKLALTETLDQLTLAGNSSAADLTADRLGAVEQRLESLRRTLGTREAAIQDAQTRLFEAKREQARRHLAQLAEAMQGRNEETIALLEKAVALQEQSILDRSAASQLAGEFSLPHERHQLLIPKHLIRAKGMEVVRNRIDETHAFGVTVARER